MKATLPLAPGPDTSRREFLRKTGLLAAAAALAQSEFVRRAVLPEARAGNGANLLADTLNGLIAFIVPGADRYSVHQGVSTPEPGGIEANATLPLIFALNLVSPAPPPFPAFADLVAFILNNVAQAVNPVPTGPFASPFANLSYSEKVTAWAVMEGGLAGPELIPLAGALPQLVGFVAYSEVGVLDLSTGTLLDTPVGWQLTNYKGVTDGTSDFKGFYQNRKKVS
ncbi:MAG: twin-arginine translocation signal domain-containing protein [Verrucomicrobia subdivision 3 bacterium]|nr:twin-arginine translocation signal domain-containing protein [Limisphaerales bacterium]